MLKNSKIFFIILTIILLVSICLNVQAVNMNLGDDDTSSNVQNVSNTDDTSSNSSNSTNATNTTNTANDVDDFDAGITNTSEEPLSTTVSSVDNTTENEFEISDILNIFLIVIGVLLILLAIAILIRLKK